MPVVTISSAELYNLALGLLSQGHGLRFQAKGCSMEPSIRDGDILEVLPVDSIDVKLGDVLLAVTADNKLVAHRVVSLRNIHGNTAFLVKGDKLASPDGWILPGSILGRIHVLDRRDKRILLSSPRQRARALIGVFLYSLSSTIVSMIQSIRLRITDHPRFY